MNEGVAREMTLEEYVYQLPIIHRARKEYETLKGVEAKAEAGEPFPETILASGFVCVNCGKELNGIAYCGECNELPSIARPAPADALRPPPIEAIRMLCGAAEHIDAIHIGSARRIVDGWLAALGEGAKEAEA